MAGSTLKLIALVAPLGLDTLGVGVILGIADVPPYLRLQLSFLFAAFETTRGIRAGRRGGFARPSGRV